MDTAEKRLHEAAVEGNTRALEQLLQNDDLILHRIITVSGYNETPLHIAAMLGHVEFAAALLARYTRLASELDSRKLSPLHLASANGHLEMVKRLVSTNSEMCLARDQDGRNPLHLAAIKGRVEVMKELLRTKPEAARQRTDVLEETVLHLCVKHNQFEALKMLLEENKGDDEFVNEVDCDGNTILHLAVIHRQPKTMKYLVENNGLLQVDVNAKNGNGKGKTYLEILAQGQIDEHLETYRDLLSHSPDSPDSNYKWLERKSQAIMVVASLIATITFQAGLTPPGGIWQDNSPGSSSGLPSGSPSPPPNSPQHHAGESIWSDEAQETYRVFFHANTIAFISSLCIILLLISGLNFEVHRWTVGFLRIIMWFTITAVALTYVIGGTLVIADDCVSTELISMIYGCEVLWYILLTFVVFGNTIRLLYRSVCSFKNDTIRPLYRSVCSFKNVFGNTIRLLYRSVCSFKNCILRMLKPFNNIISQTGHLDQIPRV